jgi:ribosomal protein S20
MQDALSAVREAALTGKKVAEAANVAYQAIDKAAKRGVIKKNAAARKKSQVAKLIAKKK